MSSSVAKTSKYTYRSTNGGNADVSIEYSADLSALSRLEVRSQSINFTHAHPHTNTSINNAHPKIIQTGPYVQSYTKKKTD